jgi:hypothetical protein
MIDVLEHPLVAGYLNDLDAALAGLPAESAAELSEQLRAHLLEALPTDADEDAVIAVLAALGPPRLVAQAAAEPESWPGSGRARRDPLLRRLARWARRQPPRTWLIVAAVTIAIGLPAGTLIFWQVQPDLEWVGSFSWWSRADVARSVTTEAAGATQITPPLRPGKIQGFAIFVYNPSDLTEFITGSADHISPGAPVPATISVSTTATVYQMGEPHAVRYRTNGPIPPHSYRWVLVRWRSAHCYLLAAGGWQGNPDLQLRVRIGWITRTEDIPLGEVITVSPSAATVKADKAYCRNRPPGG